MLHQIRKMVGMAVAIMRGDAPDGCIRTALQPRRTVPTPMAPEVGLFLDECYYDAYNTRYLLTHLCTRIALVIAYITLTACIDMFPKSCVVVWILSELLNMTVSYCCWNVSCLTLCECRCYHPGGQMRFGLQGIWQLHSPRLRQCLTRSSTCISAETYQTTLLKQYLKHGNGSRFKLYWLLNACSSD